jgi:succinate dehydrogenase hydrophobic anchor subunit
MLNFKFINNSEIYKYDSSIFSYIRYRQAIIFLYIFILLIIVFFCINTITLNLISNIIYTSYFNESLNYRNFLKSDNSLFFSFILHSTVINFLEEYSLVLTKDVFMSAFMNLFIYHEIPLSDYSLSCEFKGNNERCSNCGYFSNLLNSINTNVFDLNPIFIDMLDNNNDSGLFINKMYLGSFNGKYNASSFPYLCEDNGLWRNKYIFSITLNKFHCYLDKSIFLNNNYSLMDKRNYHSIFDIANHKSAHSYLNMLKRRCTDISIVYSTLVLNNVNCYNNDVNYIYSGLDSSVDYLFKNNMVFKNNYINCISGTSCIYNEIYGQNHNLFNFIYSNLNNFIKFSIIMSDNFYSNNECHYISTIFNNIKVHEIRVGKLLSHSIYNHYFKNTYIDNKYFNNCNTLIDSNLYLEIIDENYPNSTNDRIIFDLKYKLNIHSNELYTNKLVKGSLYTFNAMYMDNFYINLYNTCSTDISYYFNKPISMSVDKLYNIHYDISYNSDRFRMSEFDICNSLFIHEESLVKSSYEIVSKLLDNSILSNMDYKYNKLNTSLSLGVYYGYGMHNIFDFSSNNILSSYKSAFVNYKSLLFSSLFNNNIFNNLSLFNSNYIFATKLISIFYPIVFILLIIFLSLHILFSLEFLMNDYIECIIFRKMCNSLLLFSIFVYLYINIYMLFLCDFYGIYIYPEINIDEYENYNIRSIYLLNISSIEEELINMILLFNYVEYLYPETLLCVFSDSINGLSYLILLILNFIGLYSMDIYIIYIFEICYILEYISNIIL